MNPYPCLSVFIRVPIKFLVARSAALSSRMQRICVLEKAMAMERAGREVIHMEIGRTDFDTPAVVKEMVSRSPGNP
jgi:aspartate/methionine/tyrosine aminotransferase